MKNPGGRILSRRTSDAPTLVLQERPLHRVGTLGTGSALIQAALNYRFRAAERALQGPWRSAPTLVVRSGPELEQPEVGLVLAGRNPDPGGLGAMSMA